MVQPTLSQRIYGVIGLMRLIAEKNKIVEYQSRSWANGKAQLARTKTQLTGFFSKLNLGRSEEQ